jgi:hypothetical protein
MVDENRRTIGRRIANLDCRLQDRMVAGGRIQRDFQLRPPIGHEHSQGAALADLHARARACRIFALRVEQARDRARVSTPLVRVAFELIDLFDHVDRQDQIVVLEFEDCVWVVEQDVGVEDVVFSSSESEGAGGLRG